MRRAKLLKSLFLVVLVIDLALYPVVVAAKNIPGFYGSTSNLVAPAVGALPVVRNIIQGVANIEDLAGNKRVVHQDQEKAIVDWHSFDIGAEAWVHFDQQGNTNWSALNRIYNEHPSQIFGRLTADGNIFLINQNGILFGPSARVDTRSIAASALQMTNENFLNGTLTFQNGDYDSETDTIAANFLGDAVVANYGQIKAADGETVMLIAPRVENDGTIQAPNGYIGLISGQAVHVEKDEDTLRNEVTMNTPGPVTNYEDGVLASDYGHIGLYGSVVRQEGLIRSISAVNNEGKIELLASEKIVTGENSITGSPVSADPEAYHESFEFNGGEITLAGLNGSATGQIEHKGALYAPSGTVTLHADQRVLLDDDSLIDVSGNWVIKDSGDSVVALQLNSLELKNDPGQQDGSLESETVIVSRLLGTAIGDLSGLLGSDEMTSLENSTTGGDISIQVDDGDIIVKSGAWLDFSGGGYEYAEGVADTTKLLAGLKVYDISSAPQYLSYDAILGFSETVHSRFGITNTITGLGYGGANAIAQYQGDYIEGHNAGTLTLLAKTIVLDGSLSGSATSGIYQTEYMEAEEEYGEYTYSTQEGKRMPRGGTLIIGKKEQSTAQAISDDYVVDEVLIDSGKSALPGTFRLDDTLSEVIDSSGASVFVSSYADANGSLGRSRLSSESLSNAGLSNLEIYANTKVTIAEDAEVQLSPGGLRVDESADYSAGEALQYIDAYASLFRVAARGFELDGTIKNPTGSTMVDIVDTVTSSVNSSNPAARRVNMRSRTYLASGSLIDLSGETIDNSVDNSGINIRHGHIDGGSLQINDKTVGGADVLVMSDAVIDVSSGYEIDPDNDVTAGTAGAISLQGTAIVLDGTLMGYSLPGSEGGELTLHATEINISTETPSALPASFTYNSNLSDFPLVMDGVDIDRSNLFVLGQNQFMLSGITSLSLLSFDSISIENGLDLSISRTKQIIPAATEELNAYAYGILGYNLATTSSTWGRDGMVLVDVAPSEVGDSHVGLQSANPLPENGTQELPVGAYEKGTYFVYLPEASTISVAPGGSISISGVDLHLGGMLEAPAGSVTLSSIYHDLTLESSSRILAAGVNLPDLASGTSGLSQPYTALGGGNVNLSASLGSVIIASGASIDISGAAPISYETADISGVVTNVATASPSGSLSLTFRDDLVFDGRVDATSKMSTVSGGTLNISKTSTNKELTVQSSDISFFTTNGFDALSYKSPAGIDFSDSMAIRLARSLTLDAPSIQSEGGQTIFLSAPWITLANSHDAYTSLVSDSTDLPLADSRITLSAESLDVYGSLVFSGFDTVNLVSKQDIRLSDAEYEQGARSVWKGQLRTAGDLTLQAARTYPQTFCDFTLRSDDGTLTILPGESSLDAPIVSAAGTLALEADHIVQKGYIAAPAGQIAMGRDIHVEVDDAGWHYLVVDEAATTISLAPGSVTATKNDVAVAFGEVDGQAWRMPYKPVVLSRDKSSDDLPEVSEAPSSAILTNAENVNLDDNALVDLSGGGSIFTYVFMPGIEGTVNPLNDGERYVIVPGITLPGPSIAIESGGDIPAGTYSLLPESYAFLPGAYILEKTGKADVFSGGYSTVANYYTTVTGHEAVTGGLSTNEQRYVYTLMPASDALAQGQYQIAEILNGVPGALTISGDNVTLNGTIAMHALSAFKGGDINIDAINIIVGKNLSAPDENWSGLLLDPNLFDGLDIDTLTIGDAGHTQTMTVYDGTLLVASTLTLAAEGDIVLQPGSEIHGIDDTTFLANLKLQYTYDAQYGVNGFRIHTLSTDPDTGLWSGTITHGDADAGNGIDFIANDEKVVLINGDDSDFLIEEVSADVVSPYGLAQFESGTGDIVINDNSLIHATDEIGFDGQILLLGGDFYSDHSKLTLGGDAIYFIPEAYAGQRTGGLYLTDSIWKSVQGFEDVTLVSRSSLNFLGDFNLTASDTLTIDTARITAIEPTAYEDLIDGYDGIADVSVNAQTVYLLNTDDAFSGDATVAFYDGTGEQVSYTLEDTASIEIKADDVFTIGKGALLFDGFASIGLVAGKDVILRGDGTLKSAWNAGSGGTLTVQGARLTASHYTEADGSYTAADYILDAGSGSIRVLSSSESPGAVGPDYNAGGAITLSAGRIENHGVIENFAGTVNFETNGDVNGGILLASGSSILARGGVVGLELAGETEWAFFSGGTVTLESGNGGVQLEDGALVDVSNSVYTLIDNDGNASRQDLSIFLESLDADDLVSMVSSGSLTARQFSGGGVSISAPEHGVQLDGDILAHDNGGLSVSGWQDAMADNLADAADAASETEWLALLNDYLGDFIYDVIDDTLQVRGVGGAFSLYSDTVDDFANLNELLQTGGFTEEITIAMAGSNADSGDIDINDVTINANSLTLLAEQGSVSLRNSQVNLTSSLGGGSLAIIAEQDIIIDASIIDASSNSAYSTGGQVFLSAAEGTISASETTMDVSGSGNTTNGGRASFRARVDNEQPSGMQLLLDQTAIIGASKVTARAYERISYAGDQTLSSSTILNTATAIAAGSASKENNLIASLTLVGETGNGWGELDNASSQALFHYVPDVEIQGAGDLTVNTAWDFSAYRFGDQDEAGYLTLRAVGNLHIKKDITDTPTINSMGYSDSWNINLVAGANLGSPDLMATGESGGHLFIGDYSYNSSREKWQLQTQGNRKLNSRVYTEFGDIGFASSGNVYIGGEYAGNFLVSLDAYNDYFVDKRGGWIPMGFNLGTFSGAINGLVGNNLEFESNDGGAIQSAIGAIDLRIQGDLLGFYPGEGAGIRTTGYIPVKQVIRYNYLPGGEFDYTEAANGGDINIHTGGSIYSYESSGTKVGIIGLDGSELTNWSTNEAAIIVDPDEYIGYQEGDSQYSAIFSYTDGITGGIVTMGGGDIDIVAGGSIDTRVGAFKAGDLSAYAGEGVAGHYLLADGVGSIISMESIKDIAGLEDYNLSVELLEASMSLFAMGDVELGTVFNPTLLNGSYSSDEWNLTYGMDSAISVRTETGDVTLLGKFANASSASNYRLLPPIVDIISANDILVQSSYTLPPSFYGNLRLIAGGTISGGYSNASGSINRAVLIMADYDPEVVFGNHGVEMNMTMLSSSPQSPDNHALSLVHEGDTDPVEIKAAGDIEEIRVITNKKTEIFAGDDITGLYFFGQNIHSDDLSYIIANGDIRLNSEILPVSSVTDTRIIYTGFTSGGPGNFLVQAGGSIDLGTSNGIQIVGDIYNPALSNAGSDLYVISGSQDQYSTDAIDAAFKGIKSAAEMYSQLLASGDTQSAEQLIADTRDEYIQSLIGNTAEGEGSIYMTNAQISNQSEKGNLYIVAGGDINIGKTVIPDPDEASGLVENTGLYTSKGGSIYFLASGDVDVNESRLMTFYGGDIVGWSDYGNINAGRGSKTAINVNPPELVWEDTNLDGVQDADEFKLEWTPPSVGSGIRAVTYDPDGTQGEQVAPPAGDIFLAAPAGIIDAGEAGIAGNNIYLAATQIVNVQNIEVSGTSVGVPDTSASATSIGSMAGSGLVSETSNITGDQAGLTDTEERFSKKLADLAENLVPKWIAVEVVGFGGQDTSKTVDDNDEEGT